MLELRVGLRGAEGWSRVGLRVVGVGQGWG